MILNHTFIRRWIRALRSGKYPQAMGYLRTEAGYCCLGVECDLVNPTGWVAPDVLADGSSTGPAFRFHGEDLMPTADVNALSGVPRWFTSELANMNDGTGNFYGNPATFDEIADVLALALLMDTDDCFPATSEEAFGL